MSWENLWFPVDFPINQSIARVHGLPSPLWLTFNLLHFVKLITGPRKVDGCQSQEGAAKGPRDKGQVKYLPSGYLT